jgi:hypothetical protein
MQNAGRLFFKEIRIHLNKAFPFIRNGGLLKDRGHGAGRLAGTAINALIGIDEELLCFIEAIFILGRMNAVYRTNIYTRGIFHTNTRLSNYVGHLFSYPAFQRISSLDERFHSSALMDYGC